MNSYVLAIALFTFLAGYFQFKLLIYSIISLMLTFTFWQIDKLVTVEFIVIFSLLTLLTVALNIKTIRRQFLTRHFFVFLKSSDNNWNLFKRIDNGWLASELEKNIFQGNPNIVQLETENNINIEEHKKSFQEIYQQQKSNISSINQFASSGFLGLLTSKQHNGKGLSGKEFSILFKNLSMANPVLASILALMNLESACSLIHQFGNKAQKQKYLPLFNSGKLVPFLMTTSLFETLESQKTTIEGRIESQIIKGETVNGIRVSFSDIILLGTSQSNCFHLNVNVKDFNNILGNQTHIGTAICIIDKKNKGLSFKKGHKAYDDFLNYYACTGDNLFIPLTQVVSELSGLGKGLEYIYRNHCYSSNLWPLAISIPTHNISTLTAWYFAHLQKQNGRQLLSYKVVIGKLNEQFSQALRFKLMDEHLLSQNLKPEVLKFTSLLLKNSVISSTMTKLGLLREILGSNSHNIKQESKLRTFYKVSQLITELDGMSHEINQLPLIKKAALACHPYYDKEVKSLLLKDEDQGLNQFDISIFKHLGYIIHNLCKVWVYSIKSSLLARLLFPKNKYKHMTHRLAASFAFVTDISLIRWTIKSKVNTSFASYIGDSMQNLIQATLLNNYYETDIQSESVRLLTKNSLKQSLHEVQQSIKENINMAFGKPTAIFLKFLLFPLGRPFHAVRMHEPMDDDIDQVCKTKTNGTEGMSSYSPFLEKIHKAKLDLSHCLNAETAVSNATGTALTTDNYELLINRCLAAGILSIEQSENLRKAYKQILDIQLTNHFGSIYEQQKKH